MSGLDLTLEPSRPVRCVEIINGLGGRRRWPVDDKARIAEETPVAGAVVFDAHDRAFAFFKGTRTRGIYDSMKTAVETIFVGKARAYTRVHGRTG